MEIFVLKSDEVVAITRGTHGNPHHILGMHQCLNDCYVNAYLPRATAAFVLRINEETGEPIFKYPMTEIGSQGFFTVKIEDSGAFAYKLITEGEQAAEFYDPYSFGYSVDPVNVMKVVNGDDGILSDFHVKDLFGARQITLDGVQGVSFCMNMPGATRVSVVGDFNGWDGRVNPMRRIDYTDMFELFIPGDLMNTRYKFEALYRDGNTDIFADPYAEVYEVAPGNASVLAKLEYSWSDSSYMKKRGSVSAPVNIYEVHMPTWKRNSDGYPLNYLEFGKEAAMYVNNMGYNYIQFMPLMEYRDDNGWGYDTVGMFAPTSRFGTPTEFMAMVDHFHSKGIGVIMDMVSVRDVDCIAYWIDTYHLDGVRLEDEELIRALKTNLGTAGDDVMTDLRWNNEAVSRVTDFMMIPPVNRGSFMDYTCGIPFDEKDDTVWALSHDEVAYERGSYASKMSGGYEDKYADLRLLFGLTMSLPGRKLTFMGQELGGFAGFDGRTQIDWSVLEFDANSYFQKYIKELNKLYDTKNALCGYGRDLAGSALDIQEKGQVISFVRHGLDVADDVYIVCNFGLKNVTGYKLPVETDGKYREIFSSDNLKYGGEGNNNKGYETVADGVIEVSAPALSFAVFAHVK